jgi:luciferase family oxidoreductase group 1
MLIPLSVLDLSPIAAGSNDSQALNNTLDLARTADRLGYTRYWLAEHHSIPSVASTAPEIMIGHVASVTERIRVGAGGIMLPNHPPLRIAEEFRVLEALHPGRIDLGIGRAPGSSPATALALRRSKDRVMNDEFPSLSASYSIFFGPQIRMIQFRLFLEMCRLRLSGCSDPPKTEPRSRLLLG